MVEETDKVIRTPVREAARERKVVEAKQAAVDALPFGSGTWRVDGSMGLYVRCRARAKSYLIQRRIRGKLVQKVLGPMTLAQARREAQKIWCSLRPATPVNKPTLRDAWRQYLEEKPLAPKTQTLYRENFQRYLGC